MPRPATDLRHRVLAAARDVFDAKGFDGTSLRAIARAARTTIGMIYYYFPTKDALWDAVIDDAYRHFLAGVATAMGGPGPLRAQLAAMATFIASLSHDDRRVVRLALRDALASPARRGRLFERFQRGHFPLILGAVARAQAAGEVDPRLPPAMVMFAAGSMVLASQLVLGHVPLPGVPDGSARVDLALDLLYGGIAAGDL